MARNSDGTVVLKTTGKVAASPSGSGTGQVKTVQAKSSTPGPKVVPVKGRRVVDRSATAH